MDTTKREALEALRISRAALTALRSLVADPGVKSAADVAPGSLAMAQDDYYTALGELAKVAEFLGLEG